MSAADDGAMRITTRDVYNAVSELKDLVAPLVSKTADHEQRLADHEARIRGIELRPVVTPTAVWSAVGLLLTAVAVAVAIVTAAS